MLLLTGAAAAMLALAPLAGGAGIGGRRQALGPVYNAGANCVVTTAPEGYRSAHSGTDPWEVLAPEADPAFAQIYQQACPVLRQRGPRRDRDPESLGRLDPG